MRKDGSTHDLEATQDAALNEGPTRRIVHSDGSVSIMREESTADDAGARRRTDEVRAAEAVADELAADLAAHEADLEEMVAAADVYLKAQLAASVEPTPIVNADADPSGVRQQQGFDSDPSTVNIDGGEPFEVGEVIIEVIEGVTATVSPDAPVDFRYDGGAYIPIEW